MLFFRVTTAHIKVHLFIFGVRLWAQSWGFSSLCASLLSDPGLWWSSLADGESGRRPLALWHSGQLDPEPQPLVGRGISEDYAPGPGRDGADLGWVDGGERLTGPARAGGGRCGEPGQGCDSIRPVVLPGNGMVASLPFSVPVLNRDRTGLHGRDDLTDMLEFICK